MQPEELILLIAKGDQKAFRQLYEHFKEKVYNTCIYYLHHQSEAEEIAQDVFVEVYQASSKYKGQASVSTWIYRITVNKCVDRLRYNGRQKRFAFISSLFNKETGALMIDKPGFDHPGLTLENKEKIEALALALRKLSTNQQTAFILKQVEGLSQKEVAEIMGMGEKAVESLIQRAKGNLRKILENFHNKREG